MYLQQRKTTKRNKHVNHIRNFFFLLKILSLNFFFGFKYGGNVVLIVFRTIQANLFQYLYLFVVSPYRNVNYFDLCTLYFCNLILSHSFAMTYWCLRVNSPQSSGIFSIRNSCLFVRFVLTLKENTLPFGAWWSKIRIYPINSLVFSLVFHNLIEFCE